MGAGGSEVRQESVVTFVIQGLGCQPWRTAHGREPVVPVQERLQDRMSWDEVRGFPHFRQKKGERMRSPDFDLDAPGS